MIEALVSLIMRRGLRRAFRRVVWSGAPLDVHPDRPLVLFANHQYHHDGYLLWLLLGKLGRSSTTWMQEWDRFPLFAPVGARPFPPDDPARRAATIRATAAEFRETPRIGLIYFPEGRLHGSDEPLLEFDEDVLGRLHGLLGEPQWAPVAIRVVWGEEARPTAWIGGGPVLHRPDGHARDHLRSALDRLPASPHDDGRLLLDGRRGPEERIDLYRTRSFFSRYL